MLLLAFVILSASAPPPASATCGAPKFTLNKPVAVQTEPAKKPETQAAAKPNTKVAKAKPKTKPLADCDKPKKG